MKRREYLGRWRSAKAEQRFRAVEDQLWKEAFPEPPDTVTVETHAGSTRVYHWPGTGEPTILLHGMGGTSIMWWVLLSELAELTERDGRDGRPVYAIDTMGDVGRSVHRVAFHDAADLARWLDETLAGLGLERAHLVGCSYGGWLALNLARWAPGRVLSISLVDPAGMAKINYRFYAWGAKVFIASLMPEPVRRRAAVRFRMPGLEDKRVMRMVLGGQINHPFRLPSDILLSDDDLRAITVPTLLLMGGKSEIYRPEEVLARARATMPNLEAAVIPDVGHAMPIDPNAGVGRRVDDFLSRLAQPRN
jgi:pimeloyl-ACP methyl ester carboxylesterase